MRRRLLIVLAVALFSIPTFSSSSFAQTADDLFNEDVLQEVRIYIAPKDYDTFKETNFTCKQQDLQVLAGAVVSPLPRIECHFAIEFHWIFNGRDISGPQAALSSHGYGSRSNIKPSFKVEFSRYESENTFLGLKNLVLRANNQDASMMHERIAMELFRKLGIAAPRESHTRLYINDQYAGVYTIVEEVDPPFLQRNFGENGGYLYSYEWMEPWEFEYRGADTSRYSPLPFRPENNEVYPDPVPIEEMVHTINFADDKQFSPALSQYIDLNALFRELAAENFVADQDSIIGDYTLNNFFLYRFQNSVQSIFIPWDKSQAFWAADWNTFHNFSSNVLTRRALNVAPELIALYKDTLRQASTVAGGPGGWLEQEIMKVYLQIREAAYADPYKLCDQQATGYLHPCSNDEFDADVARLIDFARQRSGFVLAQIDSSQMPE